MSDGKTENPNNEYVPAFSVPNNYDECGMGLRDYFAAKVLPYMVKSHGLGDRDYITEAPEAALLVAKDCYVIADAMMAARKREGE